jgi:hypothetical protein
MKVLRTPEERFRGLPFFSFEPHYVDDLPGYRGAKREGEPGARLLGGGVVRWPQLVAVPRRSRVVPSAPLRLAPPDLSVDVASALFLVFRRRRPEGVSRRHAGAGIPVGSFAATVGSSSRIARATAS